MFDPRPEISAKQFQIPVVRSFLRAERPEFFIPVTTNHYAYKNTRDVVKTVLVEGDWSPEYFWYMYNSVGQDWCWYEKNRYTHKEMVAYLSFAKCITLVRDGIPSGMGLFGAGPDDSSIDLLYFGLFPHAIGRGLGKWFLRRTMEEAWKTFPQRTHILVDTCNLDHPKAIFLYESVGFVKYAEENVTPWIPMSALKVAKRLPECVDMETFRY